MTASLTDRSTLIRNRRRAARAPALFLQELAAREVKDRLEFVNKSFQSAAVITGVPDFWKTAIDRPLCIPDDDVLALEDGAHDLVVHAMCLHWANDPVGQLIQARRALRPDGLFLGVMLGGRTLHELRSSLAQAESDILGGLSPRVAPMGEIRDLGALLQRAGFALPVADSVPLAVSYESPLHVMRELRAMGETNALQTRSRKPLRRAVLDRACAHYTDAFGDGAGRVCCTFEMIVLTGWAPDADQPRPLRPGSATTRLADALGTSETPLKD